MSKAPAETDLDRLFRWQEEAIAAWEASHHRGIVEAMTGTGKTLVAIKAIRKLTKDGQKVSPLIVVPSIALLNQWYEKLLEQFPGERFGRIGDGWSDDFSRCSAGALPLACIGTVHSCVKAVEQGIFDHCRDGHTKSMLVADECHRYLNEDQKLFNRILRFRYDYTLGLSATIEQFEVPGLGKIVHKFGINDAVKQGVIPPFDVLNVGVSLSQTELRDYLQFTDRITDMIKSLKSAYPELEGADGDLFWRSVKRLAEEENIDLARALLGTVFKRSAIAYTAVAKLQLVPEMIRLMVSKAHRKLLVFFERIWTAEQGQEDIVRKTADSIRKSLASSGVVSGYDPIWCKLFHSDMKDFERDAALAEFRSIGPSALLACRALDEGLDVPTVDGAILVASTQSARQRLQRIGRTLRRGDGNKRPLIVLLYVKGTNDESVRIHPEDVDFKDAAKIYDVEPRQCLERISELVGLRAAKPIPKPATAGPLQYLHREWTLLASSPADVARALRAMRRGTAVQLTLKTQKQLTGKFSALLDDVIMLSEPASQTTIRNVAEVRSAS